MGIHAVVARGPEPNRSTDVGGAGSSMKSHTEYLTFNVPARMGFVNITRQVGRSLHWDPDVEQFVADAEANTLLTRERRKGYELPVG